MGQPLRRRDQVPAVAALLTGCHDQLACLDACTVSACQASYVGDTDERIQERDRLRLRLGLQTRSQLLKHRQSDCGVGGLLHALSSPQAVLQ